MNFFCREKIEKKSRNQKIEKKQKIENRWSLQIDRTYSDWIKMIDFIKWKFMVILWHCLEIIEKRHHLQKTLSALLIEAAVFWHRHQCFAYIVARNLVLQFKRDEIKFSIIFLKKITLTDPIRGYKSTFYWKKTYICVAHTIWRPCISCVE